MATEHDRLLVASALLVVADKAQEQSGPGFDPDKSTISARWLSHLATSIMYGDGLGIVDDAIEDMDERAANASPPTPADEQSMFGLFADAARSDHNPYGYIHGTQRSQQGAADVLLLDRKANGQAFPGERVESIQASQIPTGWK
jgi:hypothetical protein